MLDLFAPDHKRAHHRFKPFRLGGPGFAHEFGLPVFLLFTLIPVLQPRAELNNTTTRAGSSIDTSLLLTKNTTTASCQNRSITVSITVAPTAER